MDIIKPQTKRFTWKMSTKINEAQQKEKCVIVSMETFTRHATLVFTKNTFHHVLSSASPFFSAEHFSEPIAFDDEAIVKRSLAARRTRVSIRFFLNQFWKLLRQWLHKSINNRHHHEFHNIIEQLLHKLYYFIINIALEKGKINENYRTQKIPFA